jgi:modulator of FtsH protease
MLPVAEWTDVFVASAGAAAALAGLVFVAVSINIDRILAYRGLPERGLVTVLMLLGAVVASLFGLHPDQSEETLGWQILIGGCVLVGAVGWLLLKSRPRPEDEESHMVSATVLAAVGTLPYLVAGILLISGSDAGLDWLFSGIVGAIIAGVVNGWVLLVEILR